MASVDGAVPFFWPPTAFGLAMVARFRGAWLFAVAPGLILGELISATYAGFPPGLILLLVVVNASEQILIGSILKYFGAQRLVAVRDLVLLLAISLVVLALTSALGGWAYSSVSGHGYLEAWRCWFFGGVTASVIVAPFFLTVRWPRGISRRFVVELALSAIGLLASTIWVFATNPDDVVLLFALLIAPLLCGIGIRFGIVAVAGLASVVVYLAAVFEAESVDHPFAMISDAFGDQIGGVLETQLILVLFCLLIYAAVIVEQARDVAAVAERDARDQLQLMFADSPVPICRIAAVNAEPGSILEVNGAFAAMLGAAATKILGRAVSDFLHPDETRSLPFDVGAGRGIYQDARDRTCERQFVRLDGTPIWVSLTIGFIQMDKNRGASFFVFIAQDVTVRHDAELELVHQANHDALTDRLNRCALLAGVQELLRDRAALAVEVSLLLCDLDGFKDLNDTMGHRHGDEVLKVIADRLKLFDDVGIVARFGGDEFVLVCEGAAEEAEVLELATRARNAISMPINVDDQEHEVGVSIGVARSGSNIVTASDLLRRADLALYVAKAAGRDRTEIYANYMEAKLLGQVEMHTELRQALATDRIVCWFQPIIDAQTGRTTGAEALVRIQTVDGSILYPDSFVDIAETSGLIVPIGDRVLQLALEWLVTQDSRGAQLQVALSVSVRQLRDAGFAQRVLAMLETNLVSPSNLVIEVTERLVIEGTGLATSTLLELREAGVQIAIDDFGTGYSSLNALRWMPADIVKIDRAFISSMLSEPSDYAIVAAVVAISHVQGHQVIAEGVETAEQATALTELGCDQLQGSHFGCPRPAAEFNRGFP